MKMKVSFQDKTVSIVETYVKIDDVECEVDELMGLLNRLELMDVPIPSNQLREKLTKLNVIEPSKYKKGYFKRSRNYSVFADKIQDKYSKKKKTAKAV